MISRREEPHGESPANGTRPVAASTQVYPAGRATAASRYPVGIVSAFTPTVMTHEQQQHPPQDQLSPEYLEPKVSRLTSGDPSRDPWVCIDDLQVYRGEATDEVSAAHRELKQ